MDELISIVDVERLTGLPLHTINYALRRHGPKPVGQIGITRVWRRREDLPAILESLKKTAGYVPAEEGVLAD